MWDSKITELDSSKSFLFLVFGPRQGPRLLRQVSMAGPRKFQGRAHGGFKAGLKAVSRQGSRRAKAGSRQGLRRARQARQVSAVIFILSTHTHYYHPRLGFQKEGVIHS